MARLSLQASPWRGEKYSSIFFSQPGRDSARKNVEKKKGADKQHTITIHGMTSDSVAQSRPSVALALGLAYVAVPAFAVALIVAAEISLGVIGG